ncbi:MAG TPA: helix-turn-helix domain-containing protein [Thermoanaerobaculia bacterium]|jgi:AcrR family transcriptional regulator
MGRPATIQRPELLAVARRVFAQKGFEAATLADIAGELKVTPAALLRHVKSKQQLFFEAMEGGNIELPPSIQALESLSGHEDPRVVLRHFARELIPFLAGVISTVIAVHMHEGARELRLPFDREAEGAPPRRALRVIEAYFARARDAGRIRIGDERAAARLFLGSLHAYVLYQHVIKFPSYPLDTYVDALIDLWSNGGFSARKTKGAPRRDSRGPAPRRGGGDVSLPAKRTKTAGADVQRDDRGADRKRRVAGRRPRGARPRR